MAENTSVLTFKDLLLRVAEYYGVASYDSNGMPYVPVDDAFNLYECKKIVNDAVRMLISRPPPTGRWRWMDRVHEVLFVPAGTGSDNIDSDAARYMLPSGFAGSVNGDITYVADSGHGTEIEWRDINCINQRRQTSVLTGYPDVAAVTPYQPTTKTLGSARRWEIIFDPAPQNADTVQFPYTLHFDKMLAEGGTADSASTTTLVDATRLEPDDFFNTWIVYIIAGTGIGSYAVVTDYTKSTGTFTVSDWLDEEGTAGGTDPSTDSKYLVVPADNLPPTPLAYDEYVLSACLAKCEMEAEDIELGTRNVEYWQNTALPAAWELDRKSAPRKLGKMSNGTQCPMAGRRMWNNVTFNT